MQTPGNLVLDGRTIDRGLGLKSAASGRRLRCAWHLDAWLDGDTCRPAPAMIRQMSFHQSITHRAKTMFSAPSTLSESTGTRASLPLSVTAVQVGNMPALARGTQNTVPLCLTVPPLILQVLRHHRNDGDAVHSFPPSLVPLFFNNSTLVFKRRRSTWLPPAPRPE